MGRIDKYKGVFPAFYACYDARGEVSAERTKDLTRYLIEKGVQGLYVCGSSGECIYQSVEERKIILESVMEEAKGRITVIAHVAAAATRDSVELARHAGKCGVDAVAAIPPIYFSLPEHAIENYWRAMMDAAGTDFVIYNIPATTGYHLSMNLFRKMLTYDQVVGIKNTSMPTQDIQKFKAEGGADFAVFNGPDEQFISGRIMGADGGIGGTYGVMPELFLKADQYMKEGNIEGARNVQNAINKIIYALLGCEGNFLSIEKEILRRRGLDIGQVRLPLPVFKEKDLPVIEACEKMIQEAIHQYS